MRLRLDGTSALIMHSVQSADPSNHWSKELKAATKKRSSSRTDEENEEIRRIQFGAGLYYSEDFGPYMPAINVLASLVAGARLSKEGKKIERGGLLFLEERAPLEYDGPRDITSLWNDGESPFIDSRMGRVPPKTGARVLLTRPIFPQWSCSFEIELDPELLDKEDFFAIATKAGKQVGVGDYRPATGGIYGRYAVSLS